jgi:hypothetical protein
MAAQLLLPLALKALPGAASGIANLFGQRRRRMQEDKASQGISQLSDVFRQQLQGNYFDTSEAQGAIEQLKNSYMENNRAIEAQAGSQGLTDEARIAMMGRNKEAKATGMSNLGRSANLWRNQVMNQYQGSLGQLFQFGQANRNNFNRGLENIFAPLQSAVDGSIDLGAFDKNSSNASTNMKSPIGGTATGMANVFGQLAANNYKS